MCDISICWSFMLGHFKWHTLLSMTTAGIMFTFDFYFAWENPRAQRSYNADFWPWPLHTDISSDSQTLLMILCTVDDEIIKVFTALHWQTLFWNCSTVVLQTGEPVSIFTSEEVWSHVSDLLPINLISCKIFLQLIFTLLIFSTFCCHHPNFI